MGKTYRHDNTYGEADYASKRDEIKQRKLERRQRKETKRRLQQEGEHEEY